MRWCLLQLGGIIIQWLFNSSRALATPEIPATWGGRQYGIKEIDGRNWSHMAWYPGFHLF